MGALSMNLSAKIDRSISICLRSVHRTTPVCLVLLIVCYNTVTCTPNDVKQYSKITSSLKSIGYRHSNYGHHKSVLRHTDQLLGTKEDLYAVCSSGRRHQHVFSCHLYFECNAYGNGYVTKRCPNYLTFDSGLLTCSSVSSTCDTLLRSRRSVSVSDENINSDMGSGELSDTNVADGGLQPSGNDTIEVVEPKPNPGDDTIKLEVTVAEDHVTEGHMAPVADDVTQQKLTESLDTTTESTVKSTAEKTTATTTKRLMTSPEVVVVTDKSPKPPYVIITEPVRHDVTTTKNITKTVPENISETPSNAGVIVGVVLGLLIIGIIIVIIVILIKKKKIKFTKQMKVSVRRKKIVTKMENPQYQDIGGKDYRFSSDTPLHIGGRTANLTKFNNPNLADTPVPRVLKNESPSTAKRSSLPRSIAKRRDKRKAPPPPNPFGEYDQEKADLYETASQTSGEVEMQTFAVRNENATEPEHEPSYPLLKRSNSKKESVKVKDNNDNDNRDADVDNCPASSDSLLPKDKTKSPDKTSSSKTPDDYDATKNPFFGKD